MERLLEPRQLAEPAVAPAPLGPRSGEDPRPVYVDVGCDHAGLPLTLLYRGALAAVLAVDVNGPPCELARSNAQKLGLPLEVRQGDGLDAVPGFVDVVSICGVGSTTVISVIAAASGRIGSVVAQPNDSAVALRTWAHASGWRVTRERCPWDAGRHYAVLVLTPCRMPHSRLTRLCGILPEEPDPVEIAWGVDAQVDRDALAARIALEVQRLSPLPERAGELAVARLAQERLTNAGGADPA